MATEVHRIERLERLNNSTNGNPRYKVWFSGGGWAVTQSDAAISYEINNPEFRDTDVEITFTRAGRISFAKPVRSTNS